MQLRPVVRAAGVLAGLTACVASVTVSAQRERPESRMAAAARAFVATLNAEQKAKALIPFNSPERLNWFFVPIPGQRKGLPLEQMQPEQQKAALDLLRASLSQTGYSKATQIRELEKILFVTENQNKIRNPQQYFFTLFDEPSESGTWGWRYEGHHCSQNWTIVKGRSVASSPQFFGTNPAEVRVEVPGAPPRGTRVLSKEEDLARTLARSLSDEQKRQAVLGEKAPADVFTGNMQKVSPGNIREAAIQQNQGIPYSKLSKEQQGMVLAVIEEYASAQPRRLARQRLDAIQKAGMDSVTFAWIGRIEPREGHYYKVQGPSFLIEYDNTQNDANHVHAVWRDYNGDFGMDLLAMHRQAFPHPAVARR